MHRIRATIVLGLATLVVLVVATAASATEGTEEETTTTTVAEEPVFEDGEPAVVIPPIEEAEEEQPWTSRFLYPTIVVGTILLIVGLIIGYNHSIRNRYEVVDEQ